MAVSDTNIVIVSGRLVRDPEARGGGKVASFTIASNRWFYKDGVRHEKTAFADVSAFGYEAKAVLESLMKGDTVQVEGRLDTNKWTTESGENRSKLQIEAQRVTSPKFRTKRSDDGGEAQPVEDRELVGVGAAPTSDDDLPF